MTWKKIEKEGIYNYEVSDTGLVKALYKEVIYKDGRIRKYFENILKSRIDGKGYSFVTLYGNNIKPLQIRVHQLVLNAFKPNINNLPVDNVKIY